MPTARTPITEQIPATLTRYREAAGLTRRGLAVSAGVSPITLTQWEQRGVAPTISGLEKVVDVLGVRMSAFVLDLEAAAGGAGPRPLEVLARECRPSRDWQGAVAQAVACLAVPGFQGGLLLYEGQWARLVVVGDGRVRLGVLRGGEREQAMLAALVRGT